MLIMLAKVQTNTKLSRIAVKSYRCKIPSTACRDWGKTARHINQYCQWPGQDLTGHLPNRSLKRHRLKNLKASNRNCPPHPSPTQVDRLTRFASSARTSGRITMSQQILTKLSVEHTLRQTAQLARIKATPYLDIYSNKVFCLHTGVLISP
jgi:hypothetical protein